MSDKLFAGSVTPADAWTMLRADTAAVLVDTRTDAEFSFVGGPDLSSLPNASHRISWKVFPAMDRNPHFEDAIKEAVPEPTTTILFLCRSGVRSAAAATAMTALGYTRCFNILEGFEGDRDDERHRGSIGGWKVAGLPWVQE